MSSVIAQAPPCKNFKVSSHVLRRGKQGVLAEFPGLRAQKDLEGQWPKSHRGDSGTEREVWGSRMVCHEYQQHTDQQRHVRKLPEDRRRPSRRPGGPAPQHTQNWGGDSTPRETEPEVFRETNTLELTGKIQSESGESYSARKSESAHKNKHIETSLVVQW